MTLSPSLLAADFVNLSSQLDILVESGVNTLHFNVMDGDFVPALSFGAGILADIKKKYGDKLFLDAHLMVTEPLVGIFVRRLTASILNLSGQMAG